MPRAVIHKHILEVAAERPDASLEEIAGAVSGASIDLVEKVLEEYGDPCETASTATDDGTSTAPGFEPAESAPPAGSGGAESGNAAGVAEGSALADGHDGDDAGPEPATAPGEPHGPQTSETNTMHENGSTVVTVDIDETDLTEKQRETVRAIYEDPEASQADLAERLGVSRATICQRVNGIDGFDWAERAQFVERLLETEDGGAPAPDGREERLDELDAALEDLANRVAALERSHDGREGHPAVPLADAELAHKVIHACVRSERLTEDEELAVIRGLLGQDGD